MLPVKNNLVPDQSGLAFELRGVGDGPAAVAWEPEAVTISADEALSPDKNKPGPKAEAQDDAAEWLRGALADGARPAKDLYEEARDGQGMARRTVEHARQSLGVVTYRPANPGPWWWRLADEAHREVAPKVKELGDLGGLPFQGQECGFSGTSETPDRHTAKLSESQGASPDEARKGGCPDGERPPDLALQDIMEKESGEWMD